MRKITFLESELVKEGTWTIDPKYKDEAIKRVQELTSWLYDKFGDDEIFDELYNVEQRIRELSSTTVESKKL